MKIHICAPKRMTQPQSTALTGRLNQNDLIENLEWLLRFNPGEDRLLEATGYRDNPDSLKRRLWRCGQHDLITRIFEHDQNHPNAYRKAKR